MLSRMQNKWLLAMITIFTTSCTNDIYYSGRSGGKLSDRDSKRSENILEGENPKENTTDTQVTNTLTPDEMFTGLKGAWSSRCRDLSNAGSVNSSEKDVIVVYDNSLVLYTLYFNRSRNCTTGFVPPEQ